MQSPDLYDRDAEGLEPGEQCVQGGLILNGAVNDCLDRLDRGGETANIEQDLGRDDARYPDFVVRHWHRKPLAARNHTAKLLPLRVAARCAPLVAGEFGRAEPRVSPVGGGARSRAP